ncbi:unnamed protein product [Rotaria sp. Silwood1]|nr:unnamed protein product [Rotaria sp. Silwood1]CAF3814407.1 unnamed protein product [Rotaria sp. Silwood1]CAF4990783.1 unnamed protein product [Rotaria sp. Silwood1]
MTIAPANWGHITLSQWFGSSEHQARQAILLRRERNVLAFPEYSRGNKPLDDDTVQLVVQFYLQDGISRVSSNTKDVLKIKNELVPVRFMEMSIQEALRKFYNEYPNVKVGKSMFYCLKPRQVKISSPHETCICQTHENMSLLLHALNNYLQKKSSVDNRLSNITVSNLIDLMVCNIPAEDCFLGACDQCNDRSPSLILKGHFNTIDEDDKWSWSSWKTSNRKVDFNQIRGTITSLLNEIDEKWTIFLLHSYSNREQRTYINDLRLRSSNSSDGAPAHFKNHLNMINLMHHKDDFNIEACWTFSATGHDKGPCDGIGATVKSSASRSILMSGTIISTVDDFYYFTKKFNDDAAQVNNTNEPPVHVYLLKRDVVECAIKDVLTHRWKQLSGKNSHYFSQQIA